ncbi:MAG: acyl carrier protein [Myxococcota bacterium]
MPRNKLEPIIRALFLQTFAEHTGAPHEGALEESTVLLETGLDSLGFAILVTRLEEELQFDPFTLSKDPYYPTTFGEFVAFYAANEPR